MLRTMTFAILLSLSLVFAGCGDKGEEKKAEKKIEKKAEKKAPEAKAPEAKPEEKAPEAKPEGVAPEGTPTVDEKPTAVAVEEKKTGDEKDPSREPATEAPAEATPKAEKKAEEPAAAKDDGKASIEDRRKRVQEIYRLGRSDKTEDVEKLKTIILDEALPGYERATAIRALGNKPRAELVDTLKTLMESKDLAISSEAAIMLFQWGEKEIATPKLKDLQKMGIALRRAFFKGLKDGNYEYAPEAEEFFKSALEAPQAHVRLDAALGLLHLGQTEAALEHFNKALGKDEKSYVRLTAVSYLASARKVPEVQALLELAAKDEDPKVAARAQQILSAGKTAPKKPVAATGAPAAAPATP